MGVLHSAQNFCDRRLMYDLILLVVKEEKMQIKDEIRNKHIAVIFDGIMRTCVMHLLFFKVYE